MDGIEIWQHGDEFYVEIKFGSVSHTYTHDQFRMLCRQIENAEIEMDRRIEADRRAEMAGMVVSEDDGYPD